MFARIVLVLLAAAALWAAVARSSGASAPGAAYTVKPADTLWSIAERRYGGDPREAVWRIEERNGLAGTAIRPGQRLRLP
jgi:nucleoid-associated protein YgaU